jgi:hypothetical protein
MDDYVRDKCLLFLENGERRVLHPQGPGQKFTAGHFLERVRLQGAASNTTVPGMLDSQALIVVSHVKEEVPTSVRQWIYLPEAAKVGTKDSPDVKCRIGATHPDVQESIRSDVSQWADIWGMRKLHRSGLSHALRAAGTKPRFAVLWSEEGTDGLGELPKRKRKDPEPVPLTAREKLRLASLRWRQRQREKKNQTAEGLTNEKK